jgi:hypothetical protein
MSILCCVVPIVAVISVVAVKDARLSGFVMGQASTTAFPMGRWSCYRSL